MNFVSLLGRITKDPEVQYTASGKAYLRFTLAVKRENNKEETDFINCVAWEKRAEVIAKYFNKGERILISGSIQVSSFENKNGEKRNNTDVLVSRINFIENKYKENEIKGKEIEVVDDENDFPF